MDVVFPLISTFFRFVQPLKAPSSIEDISPLLINAVNEVAPWKSSASILSNPHKVTVFSKLVYPASSSLVSLLLYSPSAIACTPSGIFIFRAESIKLCSFSVNDEFPYLFKAVFAALLCSSVK